MLIEPKPLKILLWISLSLLPQTAEQEAAWLEAYAEAGRHVDAIILKVPSWQEAPDALNHELVKKTVDLCRIHNIDLYFGRNLWITWQNHSEYRQHRVDVFDPAYYTAFLSRVDAEARALGAIGTVADCEPYGDTIFKPWFKRNGFTDEQFRRVTRAIARATAMAPPVDLVYPAGSAWQRHYSWPMRGLGIEFLHSKTYKVRRLDDLRINPPPGMSVQLDWWGVWLAPTRTKDGQLTVAEYLVLDWPAIRRAFPELKGVWLYALPHERLDIMYKLGGGGGLKVGRLKG